MDKKNTDTHLIKSMIKELTTNQLLNKLNKMKANLKDKRQKVQLWHRDILVRLKVSRSITRGAMS